MSQKTEMKDPMLKKTKDKIKNDEFVSQKSAKLLAMVASMS